MIISQGSITLHDFPSEAFQSQNSYPCYAVLILQYNIFSQILDSCITLLLPLFRPITPLTGVDFLRRVLILLAS